MSTQNVFTESTVVVARDNHVKSSIGDEVVILDVDEGVYYGLNAVGADVWDAIQEPRSVEEIVETLVEAYAVERESCVADVIELLEELQGHNLIKLC